MTIRISRIFHWSALAVGLLILAACKDDPNEVIVYTSVDQYYSAPLFDAFTLETGIKVRAIYDVEAAKTTGLVNRLISEAPHPQADVFWNGEVMQMPRLTHEGVLAPLPGGTDYWVEFGGRGRVLIVNTEELGGQTPPTSITDFTSANWPHERLVMAYPMFGTTATHAAALGGLWGDKVALQYFTTLKQSGVRFVAGNSVVRDLVASGQALFGLTDMDDACSAVLRGDKVMVIVPDQEVGGLGALVIPNSVALVSSERNPDNAHKFIKFLIGPQAQDLLSDAGWFHVTGFEIISDPACGMPATLHQMPLTFPNDFEAFQRALRTLVVQ